MATEMNENKGDLVDDDDDDDCELEGRTWQDCRHPDGWTGNNHHNTTNERAAIEMVAAKETQRMTILLYTVMITMLITAILVSSGTYIFLNRNAENDYQKSVRSMWRNDCYSG